MSQKRAGTGRVSVPANEQILRRRNIMSGQIRSKIETERHEWQKSKCGVR